jgi:hypothetical protein
MIASVRGLAFSVALGVVAAAGMAGTAAAQATYSAPKTSWGDPDLEGVWTNASITTLERQPGMNKLVLTPEEAARFEKQFASFRDADSRPTDPESGAPVAGQDPGGYNAFWIDVGSHFGKVNGEIRSSWIVDPPTGMIPYSPQGRADMTATVTRMRSFDNPEGRSLGERCIVGYGSTSGPPMLNVLYNNNYQIVQSPGYVTIVVEMNHDARVIRLGGQHLPEHITPWMGDSIGRWEGDTLVVETTNLNPKQRFTADVRHRLYLAPGSKVVERFKRVSKDEILYEFSVEHPTAYTQTWRGQIPMRATNGPIYEYACHEGNHALPGILRGARVEEKKAAAQGGVQ